MKQPGRSRGFTIVEAMVALLLIFGISAAALTTVLVSRELEKKSYDRLSQTALLSSIRDCLETLSTAGWDPEQEGLPGYLPALRFLFAVEDEVVFCRYEAESSACLLYFDEALELLTAATAEALQAKMPAYRVEIRAVPDGAEALFRCETHRSGDGVAEDAAYTVLVTTGADGGTHYRICSEEVDRYSGGGDVPRTHTRTRYGPEAFAALRQTEIRARLMGCFSPGGSLTGARLSSVRFCTFTVTLCRASAADGGVVWSELLSHSAQHLSLGEEAAAGGAGPTSPDAVGLALGFAGGNGTEAYPFRIDNVRQLAAMDKLSGEMAAVVPADAEAGSGGCTLVSGQRYHFRLTNSIDLSELVWEKGVVCQNLCGAFDGGGFSLLGGGEALTVFGSVYDSTIQDLTLQLNGGLVTLAAVVGAVRQEPPTLWAGASLQAEAAADSWISGPGETELLRIRVQGHADHIGNGEGPFVGMALGRTVAFRSCGSAASLTWRAGCCGALFVSCGLGQHTGLRFADCGQEAPGFLLGQRVWLFLNGEEPLPCRSACAEDVWYLSVRDVTQTGKLYGISEAGYACGAFASCIPDAVCGAAPLWCDPLPDEREGPWLELREAGAAAWAGSGTSAEALQPQEELVIHLPRESYVLRVERSGFYRDGAGDPHAIAIAQTLDSGPDLHALSEETVRRLGRRGVFLDEAAAAALGIPTGELVFQPVDSDREISYAVAEHGADMFFVFRLPEGCTLAGKPACTVLVWDTASGVPAAAK